MCATRHTHTGMSESHNDILAQARTEVLVPDESVRAARLAALQRLQHFEAAAHREEKQEQVPATAKFRTMLRLLPREAVRLKLQGEGFAEEAVQAFFVQADKEADKEAEA